jgi:competence protein ComEC
MDVGQGLAVVVQTMNHVLVYDAGPSYGENFDAGEGILVPYLRSQGLSHLDALIISHNDRDHAGGVKGLVGAMTIDYVWWGEPARTKALARAQQSQSTYSKSCHEMPGWEWDQVKFRFLTWPISPDTKPNNHSCVLLIDYLGQTILLPGDIDQQVERHLVQQGNLPATLNLLLAAHHGSRTSSATVFVEHLRPAQVVFSAGYRNQHGHPHPLVVERFAHAGSQTFSTAESGAIEFTWAQGAQVEIVEYRHLRRRYWHQ